MTPHTCEETTGFDERTQQYIRCGRPAVALIKHRGRIEGPYWMCPEDADHNIKNRNAEDITPKEPTP